MMNGSKKVDQELGLNECPKCGGTGYYRVLEGDIWYAVECPCGIRKKRILQNHLKFAEIPEIYKETYLSDMNSDVYKDEKSKMIFSQGKLVLRAWLENLEKMQETGTGLYLYSISKGSGKTKAVCALANEIIKKCPTKSVKFSAQSEIMTEIRKSWSETKNAEGKLIGDMIKTEILIIDDFGEASSKDWINDKFYEIINGRYINQKITIFTSNCRISQLNFDDRIANRILERSYEIPFPEESVREHIAEKKKREMIDIIRGKTG